MLCFHGLMAFQMSSERNLWIDLDPSYPLYLQTNHSEHFPQKTYKVTYYIDLPWSVCKITNKSFHRMKFLIPLITCSMVINFLKAHLLLLTLHSSSINYFTEQNTGSFSFTWENWLVHHWCKIMLLKQNFAI